MVSDCCHQGGSVARPMYLKCIRIVCSPIGNRLTGAAVFSGQRRAMENLDKSLERRENRRTDEGFLRAS